MNSGGKLEDVNIARAESLPTPHENKERHRASDAVKAQVLEHRKVFQDIICGKSPLMAVLAGPCAPWHWISSLELGRLLAELGKEVADVIFLVIRLCTEKPRTKPGTKNGGWPGLSIDPDMDGSYNVRKGLFLMRELTLRMVELGLPVGTEILDPFTPQHRIDLLSYVWLGARSSLVQIYTQIASGTSPPVGIKNPLSGDLNAAVEAVWAATQGAQPFWSIDDNNKGVLDISSGNPFAHLILRGADEGPNYDPHSIAFAIKLLKARGLQESVFVDCNHGNSGKDHRMQPIVFRSVIEQRLAGNTKLAGLIVECELEEGNQSLDRTKLTPGTSVTDKCVKFSVFADLVREMAKDLRRANFRNA